VTTVAPTPIVLSDLGPFAQLRTGRLARRLVQLYAGLLLYGFSIALMVRGHLGLAPWDVLHLGIVDHLGLSLGTVLVATSFVVLLLWIPLREKPGIGTIANALVIGPSADATLDADHPLGLAATNLVIATLIPAALSVMPSGVRTTS